MIRNVLIAPGLFALGLLAFSAQTPAPAAPRSVKPLRHLEYSFNVSEQGMSSYMDNGINGGVEVGSGVGSDVTADGGRGTISVDVLSLDSDGSLVVRVSERVEGEARPRQAYTCNVYGNTSVLCSPGPAPSEAEYVLMSYLGRRFVDAAPWDSQNHWQRTLHHATATITEDFTMTDMGDGNRVKIHETKKSVLHNGDAFGSQTDDISISYDRAMEIPVAIRDDAVASTGGGSDHSSFDFELVTDSLAKH